MPELPLPSLPPQNSTKKGGPPPFVQVTVGVIAVCFFVLVMLALTNQGEAVANASVSVIKYTPVPTPAPKILEVDGVYSDLDSLVNSVIGSSVDRSFVDIHLNSPSRKGYEVDVVIASPETVTRRDLLRFAYTITHEFYHDFTDRQPDYLTIRLRSSGEFSGCEMKIGIGGNVAAKYVPADPPDDFGRWLNSLVVADNRGDLPGQSQSFMAYGIDPASQAGCILNDWKLPS